ncbi:MAG: type II secretion system protein N [Burkholderiales bacterium]
MRLRLPIARIASVLLFAALCAIVAGWALQLLAPRAPVAPAGAVAQVQGPPDLSAAGQLFGGVPRSADAQVQAAPSNIQVSGVLASGARGVALLAIDGRPAKPFAVGEPVSDGMTVRSITGDTVELDRGAGGPPMRLPAPARGSVAVLTSGPQRSGGNANEPLVSLPGAPVGLPPLPPRTLPPPPQEALTPAIAPGPVTASQPGDPGAPGTGPGNPPPRMPGLAPVGSPPAAQ